MAVPVASAGYGTHRRILREPFGRLQGNGYRQAPLNADRGVGNRPSRHPLARKQPARRVG